jgi:type IV secretory pathway VirB10-like protein
MFSNRLAFAGLAVACVTAAAGGGYLATRQTAPNATSTVAPALSAEAVAPAPAVRETEAVIVAETKPSVAPLPAAAPPAPRRVAPPVRPAPRPAANREPLTTRKSDTVLDRTWPTTAAAGSQTGSSPTSPASEPVESSSPNTGAAADPLPTVQEIAATPEPPQPRFEELVVPADSVIGLRIQSSLSSERARVEDGVEARVVRDVRVGSEVAVPAGSRALGSVTVVDRGGKFKERAQLGIRFHTLVLGDGTRLPISTDTIYRYGDARGDSSAKKIGGGAVAGAILGAIFGGAKGAAVGATAGAGGGTAVVMSGDRSAAEFASGTEMTARIMTPVTVTVDR